jgi:hypothetical protein
MIAVAFLAPIAMLVLLLALERLERSTVAEATVEFELPRAEPRREQTLARGEAATRLR